jgi:hypothetical protein
MKTLIILTTIISMIFTGFAFAEPPCKEDCPQGGPPEWVKDGQPGPPPWVKDGQSGPPENMQHGKRGGRGHHPSMMDKKGHRGMRKKMEGKFKKMRKDDPKEYERLMKLRKDDPAAFRKEIHKRFEKQFKKENPEAFKRMQEMKKIKKNVDALNKEYKKCEDADKKKEIKQKMRDFIGRAFDITQEFREKKINDLEKKTKNLRKNLKKRGKNKKEMVNLKLKGLIDGEETVKW